MKNTLLKKAYVSDQVEKADTRYGEPEFLKRNPPVFQDTTEPKNKRGNMWNFGVKWNGLEKVL